MLKLGKLIATSMFTALLAFPLSAKAEERPLIGANYPPLPEGVEEMGGWLINDPYAIERVLIEGQNLLLLSRLRGRDSSGKASFKVVNVLPLPPIAKTEEIIDGSMCSINGKSDPNFIAIMKLEDDRPYLTKARKAWRIEGEEFEEVNVANYRFKCENLAYGL